MQSTGSNRDKGLEIDPKEPLSKEFLVQLATVIPQNELAMMALEGLPKDMKTMLKSQNTEFLVGFINSSQFTSDTLTHFVVNPLLREHQENPREDMDPRAANIFRALAIANATTYYAVQLLVERGYINLDVVTN